MSNDHHHVRTLGVRDMTLFTVSAVLLLETLAASASIGVSSIAWWCILGVAFFIPYGLISAELGTTYPEQGGIYAWVRDAFGSRWGTRVTWLYWLNNVLWQASLYVLFAGIFSAMFLPNMNLVTELGIAIGLVWLTFLITTLSLSIGKWIPNAGAIIKIVTFAALIVGGIWFAMNNDAGLANDFSLGAFVPEWGSSTQYISTIIYGMVGFELMSSASEEMKDPVRDVPRSILWSGVLIFLAYVFGTFAILAAIPVDSVDLVDGLVDTFVTLFGGSAIGNGFATLLGVMALFTILSNGATWAMGANRAAAQAAIDGELPKMLAKEHAEYGTPVGAAFVMATLTTIVLLAYAFVAGTNADLFWSLFAASAVLFLLPYVGAVLAFLHMREHDADRHRPFRVGGGMTGARLATLLCAGLLVMSIVLFMYVPDFGFDWPVVIGAGVSIVLGEIAIRYAERERRGD